MPRVFQRILDDDGRLEKTSLVGLRGVRMDGQNGEFMVLASGFSALGLRIRPLGIIPVNT